MGTDRLQLSGTSTHQDALRLGSVMADSLEYAFEPQTMKLNDEDFVVELEPTCERRYCDFEPDGYVGSHSDDYGPQCWDTLFEESTDDRISTAPQAEYVYRYISWDRTVMVALSGGQFAKVPSKIAVTSTAVGYHLDGAVLIVDGRAVKARGARICETTAEDKRAIEKERGALGVLAADRAAAAGRSAVGVVEADSEKNAVGSQAGDTEATGGANRVEEEDEAADLQRAGGTDDSSQGMGAANVSKAEQKTWIFGDLRIEKRGDEPHVKIGDGEFGALEGQCRKIVNAMLALGATSEDKAKSTKDILGAASILSDIRLRTPFLAPGASKTVRKKLWNNYCHQVGEGKKGKPYQYYLGLVPSTNADATATEGA